MKPEPCLDVRFPNTLVAMQEVISTMEAADWFQALELRIQARVLLVLDELISNQIHFAGEGVSIELRMRGEKGDLLINLGDNGVPFDPRKAPEPAVGETLEDLATGGRGIKMVKESVASLIYQHEDGWNRLTLRVAVA